MVGAHIANRIRRKAFENILYPFKIDVWLRNIRRALVT
jgi:hypothetical protein